MAIAFGTLIVVLVIVLAVLWRQDPDEIELSFLGFKLKSKGRGTGRRTRRRTPK